MGKLSVHLNRFSLGQFGIAADKVLPKHQKELQACVLKILRDNVPAVDQRSGAFSLRFQVDGKLFLRVGEREFEVKRSPAVKKAGRIFRFYQNVGLLPRQLESRGGMANREEISTRSVRAVSQSVVPGTTANLWAGTRFADDSLSLYRRLIALEYGPNTPFSKQLGYYAGSLWSAIFCKELFDGLSEYDRATEIGDGEGKRRAEAKFFSGGALLIGSLSYLAGKILDEKVGASVGASVLSASNLLFGVGALIGIAASALGAIRCAKFSDRLSEYLENPNLTEVEKMRGAWTFLKDSLVVSTEEEGEIEEEVRKNYPSLSEEKKKELIKKKIEHLTETKVKYMKRRTSNKSLQIILENADSILEKLNSQNQTQQGKGVKEATQLLKEIQKENRTKKLLYVIGTIAGILSFIGILFMTLTPAALFPFVLCGIASATYLILSLYYYAPAISSHAKRAYCWIKEIPNQLSGWVAKRVAESVQGHAPFLEKERIAG